ncbi:MAG: GNAT family N-acetyltransferase [Coriobacteriia bacterium]|nr:GNAT family N-acetyltransferase [Coriobacteriia bacterium]
MIRALTETDDPSGFSCGSPELDRYLTKHALANAIAGVSVTYVHVSTQGRIDGFVTVAGTSIRAADAACLAHLPGCPLPALLIARLGVDTRSQGQGIGRSLLAFALGIAVIARERLGCVGVVVDAKDGAVSFYEHLGFEPLELECPSSGTTRMLLEIGSLLDALNWSSARCDCVRAHNSSGGIPKGWPYEEHSKEKSFTNSVNYVTFTASVKSEMRPHGGQLRHEEAGGHPDAAATASAYVR